MSHRHVHGVGAVIGALACLVAAALVLAGSHARPAPATSSVSPPVNETVQPQPSAASASNGLLFGAIDRFALAYGRYLNGDGATVIRRVGSITATAQAVDAGQIPAAFRDGRVRIQRLVGLQSSCCSASVTVVLANREEQYPFTEQLLLEQHGWIVDQITPPDLSMDRHLRPAPHVPTPAGGLSAARAFAVAYVNYRSGESAERPAMNAAAVHQIHAGTDSLAGQTLPKAIAELTSIQVGPPSGDEFAATVAVTDGGARLTFSFLMLKTAAGWECVQYL